MRAILTAVLLSAYVPGLVGAQSLTGSMASMNRQRDAARQADIRFHETAGSLFRSIEAGRLVEVVATPDYRLHAVSFPFARPEAVAVLDRLAADYHQACGQRLVVTSLSRPRTEQPRNGSTLSVHPAGLAIDLRRSVRRSCRRWLEDRLLGWEARGLVEATRERWPAHYHVAVLPRAVRSMWPERVAAATRPPRPLRTVTYEVGPGDTLWDIARSMDSTADLIRAASGLRTARIYPGQRLIVPQRGAEVAR